MHRYFEINEGGHNIRCKIYFGDIKNIRNIVLFCHGFAGHKDNGAAEKFAGRLTSKHKDWALVTFNWPAHGDDVKKSLHLDDCTVYMQTVINYLRAAYQPEKLYCSATSFGGYLTLKYISEHGNPFGRIVLRCPAVNMHEVLTGTIMSGDELAKLQKKKEIPVGFDRKIMIGMPLLEELRANDIRQRSYLEHAEKILSVHGTADEVVPFEASKAFAEENLIDFVPVEGADHRFISEKKMEQAIKLFMDFFEL